MAFILSKKSYIKLVITLILLSLSANLVFAGCLSCPPNFNPSPDGNNWALLGGSPSTECRYGGWYSGDFNCARVGGTGTVLTGVAYHYCNGDGTGGDYWGPTGLACTDYCNDNAGNSCGNCGTIDCDGNCVGEGVCAPGTTQCNSGNYLVCSNTCNWNNVDADYSSAACSCESTGLWNLGGEITTCCGDDAAEFRIVETHSTDAPSNFWQSTDACCDANTDCADANTCTTSSLARGVIPQRAYCLNSIWYGGDYSSAACTAVAGASRWQIGGEISDCCGDDLGEYRIVETAGADAPSNFTQGTDACCTSSSKCVEDNVCSPPATTRGTIPQKAYCENSVWYGGDYSNAACDAIVAPGYWNIGGDILTCCTDDLNEFVIEEQDSLSSPTCGSCLWDGVNSNACCDDTHDCVDDDLCFDDHTLGLGFRRNLGESNDFNDEEICHDRGWHDPDESPYYCGVAGFTWLATGEIGPFTQYTGLHSLSCCGDDVGYEFIIYPEADEAGSPLCSDNPTDRIWNNTAVPRDEMGWVAGTAWGEDPANLGSFIPLDLANVTVMLSEAYTGNSGFTNGTGWFNISVKSSEAATVNIFREHYQTGVFTVEVNSTHDYYLNLLYSCDSSCTSTAIPDSNGVRLCDKNCDGIFGCSFPAGINDQGQTVGDVCHGVRPGFQRDWNTTHVAGCCDTGFVLRNLTVGTEDIIAITDSVVDVEQRSVGTVITPLGKVLVIELIQYTLRQ